MVKIIPVQFVIRLGNVTIHFIFPDISHKYGVHSLTLWINRVSGIEFKQRNLPIVNIFCVVNLLFGWSWDTNTLWLYRDWIGKQLAVVLFYQIVWRIKLKTSVKRSAWEILKDEKDRESWSFKSVTIFNVFADITDL